MKEKKAFGPALPPHPKDKRLQEKEGAKLAVQAALTKTGQNRTQPPGKCVPVSSTPPLQNRKAVTKTSQTVRKVRLESRFSPNLTCADVLVSVLRGLLHAWRARIVI